MVLDEGFFIVVIDIWFASASLKVKLFHWYDISNSWKAYLKIRYVVNKKYIMRFFVQYYRIEFVSGDRDKFVALSRLGRSIFTVASCREVPI